MKVDSLKHLTFKGVSIDGSLKVFVSKMETAGFKVSQNKNGVVILIGDFASYKNCSLEVSTISNIDLVNKISVSFPECEDWQTLSANYFNLKSLLSEKYGDPTSFSEEFQSYTPDNDRSKFNFVTMNHCKYFAKFSNDNGNISLSIETDSRRRCYVQLIYEDKINNAEVKKIAIDDL